MSEVNSVILPKAIFLMGPTASGKTALAIQLCKLFPMELISVDSALIYKEMDIGTAKPTVEELNQTPHRLLNILDPSERYSVSDFYRDALSEMKKISTAGRIPLLVGGTMLYFKALLEGLSPLPSTNLEIRLKIKKHLEKKGKHSIYQQLMKIDPFSAKRIHPNDFQRLSRALEVFLISGKTLTELTKIPGNTLPYQIYQFIISPENRKILHQKIEQRFYRMLFLGFEKEVRKLFTRGDLDINMPSVRCVGYRQMWSYIKDEISYDEMIYRSICATKQLAKRQITWLRNWKEAYRLSSEKPLQALQEIKRIVGDIES